MNNALSLKASQAILKSAVQYRMFNADGSIADIRRSVLVEVLIPEVHTASGAYMPKTHAVSLYSSLAFDSLPSLHDAVSNLPDGSIIEVWDGRYLNSASRTARAKGYLKLSNVNGTLTESDSF